MARIPRAEFIWRRLDGGRVRHAIQMLSDDGGYYACGYYQALCSWELSYPTYVWYDDPSRPECRKCARRVEPAKED